MSKVFIPASIKDKATRDTFIAIVKNLGDGNKPTVSDYDPTATTVGTPGQLIYSEATNSIWMFVSNTWVKILGTNGLNNSTVFLYNKSTASSLSKTFSGDFTYTFSTGALTGGTLNGWSTTLPSLSPGENLFVSLATASANTTTDTISTSEFSTPEVFSIGAIDGANTSIVYLYQVTSSASAPAAPSGTFTYTFATQALSSGTLNGWSQTTPTVGQGQYLWTISASAFAIGATDTIAASEFTSPTTLSVPAPQGFTGDTVIKGKVYYGNLQSSSPSAPNATSWNLATSSFIGLTSNWSENQPPINATDTNLREWSSFYNVTIDGATNSQTISFTTPSGAIQFTDDIESDNFSAGSAGWRLQRNTGNAEFGAASIRGTLTANQIGAGTITANKLDVNDVISEIITAESISTVELDASKITAGSLSTDYIDVDSTLSLDNSGSGIIGGRDSRTDYTSTTGGFYLGRELRSNSVLGFEVSHTSINSSTTALEGIIHSDQEGLNVFNPSFSVGGTASGGITEYTTSQTVNLSLNETITVNLVGGGGAGGNGSYGPTGGGARSPSGGTTTVVFRTGSATGTIIKTITASGGLGGILGVNGGKGGTPGASSPYNSGAGGTGAGQEGQGGDASSANFGAAGGGGGGRDTTFGSDGDGGGGGSAGTLVTETFNTGTSTQNIYAIITVGTGGVAVNQSNTRTLGGDGAAGVVAINSLLGGITKTNFGNLLGFYEYLSPSPNTWYQNTSGFGQWVSAHLTNGAMTFQINTSPNTSGNNYRDMFAPMYNLGQFWVPDNWYWKFTGGTPNNYYPNLNSRISF